MSDNSWNSNDASNEASYNSYQNRQRGSYNYRQNSTNSYNTRTYHSTTKRNNQRHDTQGASLTSACSDVVSMLVPSRFVGRIIGRGGAKINELQSKSLARIQVTKKTEGDNTIIEMTGESNAIELAQTLINDLITERNRHVPQMNIVPQATVQTVEDDTEEVIDFNTPDWQAIFRDCEEKEAAKWNEFPAIQKLFYEEHPEVTALTSDDVDAFRKNNNNIIVERTFKTNESKPIPKPVQIFEHAFHNYPDILAEIYKAGFQCPTPIQSQAWPVLLNGEDLIGIAQTGTGKTLAFLLPALIHIDGQLTKSTNRKGPAVLVMAPTRELALQIEKEAKKYEYKGITAGCLYGGGNRNEQINILSAGVDIIIATPGRLNDLMVAGYFTVDYVTYVVLDEADRMLDMGFEPQIRKVMYSIRPSRQTVMTSATWPLGVRRLAQSYMVDPIQVYVGTLDLAATHTVTQIIEMIGNTDEDKYNFFTEFITNLTPAEKVIVFCGKKARADHLSSELALAGFHVQSIHGDRDQVDREQALKDIQDGTVNILIATDVASRGLDIDDITHVINYDFPRNIEEYVHRVGRTGRAGKTGQSISYFTRQDWAQAKELIAILEEAEQHVPSELYDMAERFTTWKEKKDAEKSFVRGKFGGHGSRNNRW